jgi:hypothetical protein
MEACADAIGDQQGAVSAPTGLGSAYLSPIITEFLTALHLEHCGKLRQA